MAFRFPISAMARSCLAAPLVTGVTVIGLGPATAYGATTSPAAQLVAGSQAQVACLTSDLCVLVGQDDGAGDVIAVTDGRPGKVDGIKISTRLYSVSCPAPAGCIAIGPETGVPGVTIVELNSKGQVAGVDTINTSSGVSLTHIACRSLYACTLWGTNTRTGKEQLEFAQYNGTFLHLQKVPLPAGTTSADPEAVSCAADTCTAVGSVRARGTEDGFLVTSVGSVLSRVRLVAGMPLGGVSCTSTSLCYAAGSEGPRGAVLTLKNGLAGGASLTKSGVLDAIACSPTSCVAVGREGTSAARPGKAPSAGMVADVTSGRVSGVQVLSSSTGLTSVASPLVGPGFTALGRAQGGSLVTSLP